MTRCDWPSRLRRHGLRDARPLPSRDRGAGARLPAIRARRHPAGDRPREAAPRRRRTSPVRPPEIAPKIPRYYLISNGRPLFEEDIGYRIPLKRWLLRAYVSWATPALPRHHRHRDGAPPGRPAPRWPMPRGMQSAGALALLGLARADPGLRPRGRARQPHRHGPCSARGRCRASSSATASRRPCEPSSSCRRS